MAGEGRGAGIGKYGDGGDGGKGRGGYYLKLEDNYNEL